MDSKIAEGLSNTNFGSDVFMDIDSAAHTHGLIKYPAIIGSGPSQVPPGTTITSAILTVRCFNKGLVMKLYRLIEDWNEGEVTWNERMSGQTWSNSGADGSTS